MGSLEERRNYFSAFESTRAKTDQQMSSEDLYKAGVELEYDPVQSKLHTKSYENGFCDMRQQMSSENLYKAGVELEFDPLQSKLVPKTPKHQGGTSKTEEAFKKGQKFDFDPASGLIPIKKERRDKQVKVEMNKRGTGGFF